MAIPGININRTSGGLGRQQPGEDYISALLFQQATLPSGFGASDRVKKVTTLAEAEALGIVDTHADETKATGGEVEITAAGAAADVWTISITPAESSLITLGTYTEKSGDGVADIAEGLTDAINLLTISHGFSASFLLGVISLTAAPKWGEAINGAGLAGASTGAGTTTVTQFSGGVGSVFAVNHYHVAQFFKMRELVTGLAQGVLYIGLYNIGTGTYDGTEIATMQTYADGDIRQIGVYLTDTFASSMVTDSQTVADGLAVLKQPLSVVVAADLSATTLSALSDLRTLDSERVSVVLGEDKEGEGGRLTGVVGRSITSLGATLGHVSNANVNENIGWRSKFNVINGTEFEVLQFATGEEYKTQSAATLTELNNKGYIFLTKEIGVNGSFHQDAPTCTLITSDFAYIENNRTVDKAARLIYQNLVNKINAPLFVDATTGKLNTETIDDFTNDAFRALENMAQNAEISTDGGEVPATSVLIDPDQDVLTTSEIVISVTIVPVGVARQITVNIGFATSIS